MFLEVATTLGAVGGAYLAARVSTRAIGIIFGVTLLYSAWSSFREPHKETPHPPNALAEKLKLTWRLPGKERPPDLHRAKCSRRFRHHVHCRTSVWPAWHRLRSSQGPGHGPRHEASLQSVHHHQQFHDWRNRCRKRRHLSWPRLYRARASGAGDVGSVGGLAARARACWSRIRVPVLRVVFALVIVALGVEMIYSGATGRL